MKQIENKSTDVKVNEDWAKEYRLLTSLGFILYDPEVQSICEMPEPGKSGLVMVENDYSRNMIVVVLEDDGGFDVYVQEDAGCGFRYMPFRWAEIDFEWLNNLRKSFQGEGFKK